MLPTPYSAKTNPLVELLITLVIPSLILLKPGACRAQPKARQAPGGARLRSSRLPQSRCTVTTFSATSTACSGVQKPRSLFHDY